MIRYTKRGTHHPTKPYHPINDCSAAFLPISKVVLFLVKIESGRSPPCGVNGT